MAEQRTAKSVRAYARGARLALWLQVVVAAAALIASLWLGTQIKNQASLLKVQKTQLGKQAVDIQAQKVTLGEQDAALLQQKAELDTQLQALELVQNALRLMNEPIPKNELAINQLQAAVALIGQEPSLIRTLAEAQFANSDPEAALATLSALFATTDAASPVPIVDDVIRLAKYHCATGHIDTARALIEGAIMGANQDAMLGDDGFATACAELIDELDADLQPDAAVGEVSETDPNPENSGTFPVTTFSTDDLQASSIDPQYAIKNIFPHIREEKDRAAAVALSQTLCDAGYAVPGIELVTTPTPYPGRNDLRFYYEQQKNEALFIADLVSDFADDIESATWAAEIRVRPLSGYQNLPMDRVELWLLAAKQRPATAVPAGKTFSCDGVD